MSESACYGYCSEGEFMVGHIRRWGVLELNRLLVGAVGQRECIWEVLARSAHNIIHIHDNVMWD